MPPGGQLYNIWQHEDTFDQFDVNCLLPTGILVSLRCSREETLTSIKSNVWKAAKSYPFFNQLLDINFYIFQCINQNAEHEELLDEKRRLCDVQPFSPDFKVVIRADDAEDKVLNGKISNLINKGLNDFDMMRSDEIDDFRKKMLNKSDSIQKRRKNWTWEAKAWFLFPPRLESGFNNQGTLKRQMDVNLPVPVQVKFMDNPLRTTVISVSLQEHPSDILKKAFKAVRIWNDSDVHHYVLKLRGKQEYLIGNKPLYEYKYIREMVDKLSRDKRPEVVVVRKETMQVNELLMDPIVNSLSKKDTRPPPTPVKIKSTASLTWRVNETVRITIHKAWSVNVDSNANSTVRVRVAIFHGGEMLGDSFITGHETSGTSPVWNEYYESKIRVSNLPRMARLCLLIGTTNKKTLRNLVPLAWVNTTFFDYKNQLRTGKLVLHMWPAVQGDELKPLGTVESNPGHRAGVTTAIEISFDTYPDYDTIIYPPLHAILQRAKDIDESGHGEYLDMLGDGDLSDDLRKIVEKHPLENLDMQEMEKVWKRREECLEHVPHSLPRLLQSVQWDNSIHVTQMIALLQKWPELKPEEAMELLDYKYADLEVRKFAVKCLEKMSDEELSQYLLQLVQALKYETYLDCDLGDFLLRRAIDSRRIGHFFFWHLRAEMHNMAASTRFGLMLEAYCRCNIAHMHLLEKQVGTLNRMQVINEMIKTRRSAEERTKLIETMREMLPQFMDAGDFRNFESPLSIYHSLLQPRVDKCKFMDSKMAPLFMVFKNTDVLGDDVSVLYKNGDDLRQDMLTLQVLQIMDNIWRKEGLNFRLIPYRALATGDCSGLIEIVTQASTISTIQLQQSRGKKISAAFKQTSLLDWLKDKNVTENELDRAIEDFTYSCAGYCVATYVLGIGDRHNDNIMVKETGQLFHIDFGHFLGKFKSKFGVKRERVPFVLTHDFVHVIVRGDNKKMDKKALYERFRGLCEKAFLILRRHGNILITLFAMMLSSGIPELSDSTIGYLRESLVLDKSEDEAVKHFNAKLMEALQQSWKTSVNWTLHNIAH